MFKYKSRLKDHYKKISRCNEAIKKTQFIPRSRNFKEHHSCSACDHVSYSKRYFELHKTYCLKLNKDVDGELCNICGIFRSKSHSNMLRHKRSANCKEKRNGNDSSCQVNGEVSIYVAYIDLKSRAIYNIMRRVESTEIQEF